MLKSIAIFCPWNNVVDVNDTICFGKYSICMSFLILSPSCRLENVIWLRRNCSNVVISSTLPERPPILLKADRIWIFPIIGSNSKLRDEVNEFMSPINSASNFILLNNSRGVETKNLNDLTFPVLILLSKAIICLFLYNKLPVISSSPL